MITYTNRNMYHNDRLIDYSSYSLYNLKIPYQYIIQIKKYLQTKYV